MNHCLNQTNGENGDKKCELHMNIWSKHFGNCTPHDTYVGKKNLHSKLYNNYRVAENWWVANV